MTSIKKIAFFFVMAAVAGLATGAADRCLIAGQNVEKGYKIINGAKIYYEVYGRGFPVVFVHGGPGLDRSYMLPQMERIGVGYKLIFYDQRASGKSSADVEPGSMTMETFVKDLEGIRKAFKLDKMNLVGHSWGGLVAMLYAVRYPQRLRSLVLLNSTPASASLRESAFAVLQSKRGREDSIANAELTQTDAFKQRDPVAMMAFFRLLFRASFYDRHYADSLTFDFDSTYAMKSAMQRNLSKDKSLMQYDLHGQLGKITCPTLIFGGDHDMVTPEANERIHKAIKGSKYILIKNCGHFPFIEAQEQFFPILRNFYKDVQ